MAKARVVLPRRKRGVTKHNFCTLFDFALLGVTSHSKVPLLLAMMLGSARAALIGPVGEYVGFIHTMVRRMPLVIPKEGTQQFH